MAGQETGPGGREFAGTSRFQLLSQLGAGGMGVVYEALDRDQQCHVALKTLKAFSASALVRFKREFRALQDLHHPNLVGLGELFEASGHWFFTMELVQGTDLLSWLLPRNHAAPAFAKTDAAVDGLRATLPPEPARPPDLIFDEPRLRAALPQLARGLDALHGAGRVHRDIKPSNVLVTSEGRLVLLDFGLVTEATSEHITDANIVGTVAYMAPEQAASKPVGPEADWYSLGVVLFEALTGRLPHTGAPFEVLLDKQRFEPPAPRTLSPRVPEDLSELAVELLRFDPIARRAGRRLLGRLFPELAPGASSSTPSLSQEAIFIGRTHELATLQIAHEQSRQQPVLALVEGESGVGKSALVRRFVDDVGAGAIALVGRCYEREAVPYKAFDGVIDSLSRLMLRLPAAEAAALLPANAALLAQVFPVLMRARAFATSRPAMEIHDPQELRSRVFAALRELLGKLASRRSVVLVIDDLQWADADSFAMLGAILRGADAPRILLVATGRPGTRSMVEGFDGSRVQIPLAGLPPSDASALASELCRFASVTVNAAAIASESAGHPLFIHELVRGAGAGAAAGGLDEVLFTRVLGLGPDARHLLDLVVAAGSPIRRAVLRIASESEGAELTRHLAELRAAHLVRSSTAREGEWLEPYHDRIRESVFARLERADRRECHLRIARALESDGQHDALALALHWHEAGDPARALRYTTLAAEQAVSALAFDRAASLYEEAYERAVACGRPQQELKVRRAAALSSGGRSANAAEVYLSAAQSAEAADSLGLRMRAAEELLRCGRLDVGVPLVAQVLKENGLSLPGSRRGTVAALLSARLRLRLRGLGYRERSVGDIAKSELSLIDLCWTVASSLALTDHIVGALFQSRALRLALDAGEPLRIARCLMAEQGLRAAAGDERAARRVGAIADALAERMGNPVILGMNAVGHGMSAHLLGQFLPARAALEDGVRRLRDEAGMSWELDAAHNFLIESLFYLGDLRELGRLVESCVDDARGRGDRYAVTTLRIGLSNVVFLLGDDPEGAREAVAEAMKRWSPEGFHVQHWYALIARLHIALYRGDTADALAALAESWRPLWGSQILRIQHALIVARHLRARVALAAALEAPASADRPLAVAEGEARRLERVGTAWSRATAALIAGGVAAARGQAEVAIARLGQAAEGFRALDIEIFAVAALHRQGQLLGAAGEAQVRKALGWWGSRGVARPDRFLAMLAPQGALQL